MSFAINGLNVSAGPQARVGLDAIAIERNCLSLPPWFPADKAAAVLRQQKKQFALLADHQGVMRAASLEQLALAPDTKSVMWCGRPLGPAVSPSTPSDEAQRLMEAHAHSFLPVVLGGVVLGILTPDAIPAETVVSSPAHAVDPVSMAA